MKSLRRSFRSWWQVPRKVTDREDERAVTFLELFYDLVYVVIIAELAHALAEHIDLAGIGTYVFLFVIVWWAWFNGAIYHDLHGNNDVRTRVFTFLQMFTVAAMAVFAHNALGEGSVGFALSYAAFQLILTFLWWRTGVHDINLRHLSRPYVVAYLISTCLFIASVFVPAPWRFILWGVAILLTLIMPLMTAKQLRTQQQDETNFASFLTPSGVERFGLFTIIVLGEVIVGVVQGVAGHHQLSWWVGGTAMLGLLVAIGLWWVYFDFVSNRLPLPKTGVIISWLYLHLPMTMSMAAAGAGVLNVIVHTGEDLSSEVRWLLVGTTAMALMSIALLMLLVRVPETYRQLHRRGSLVTLISAVLIVLLGFSNIETLPLLMMLVLLLLVPIFYGFQFWVKMLATENE